MLTANQERQLDQLRRTQPDLFLQALKGINQAVAGAMQEALSRAATKDRPTNDNGQPANDPLANIRAATSAAGIGADIKRLLGQSESAEVQPIQWTEEQTRRGYEAALKPNRGKHRPFGAAAAMNKLDF